MKQKSEESLIDDRRSEYQSSLASEEFKQHFSDGEGFAYIGRLI